MQTQLPETMNFMRQVERNYRYQGALLLSRLDRLSEVLLDNSGEIQVLIEFGTSVGFAGLKGSLSGSLPLECQRCLQPMVLAVNSSFRFAFVQDEDDAELLPETFEPYLIEGEEQSLLSLLEDELLLSLPMVAMHETDCSGFMTRQAAQVKKEKEASHPFAALKALKKDV